MNGFCQMIESAYGDRLEPGTSIYVITNREADPSRGNPFFLNQVKSDPSLTFLHVTYRGNDSLEIVPMDSTGFLSGIMSKSSDWLLFVHGDSKTFGQAVMRGFDIQHLYAVNVIVFSWPSKAPDVNGIKNFKNSRQNVIKSSGHFTSVICLMRSFRTLNPAFQSGAKLSMFLHSLGNYYLEHIVERTTSVCGPPAVFDNLIVNAAAVNQEHHRDWVEQLSFQNRIYITANVSDFNLKGVRIFTKDGKQLGEKVKSPLAANASYIHFTKAVGLRFPTGITHTYFIGKVADTSDNIRLFYHDIMHGGAPDFEHSGMFEPHRKGWGYEIIY
jgi:esterase/lipase superfamily enzyme